MGGLSFDPENDIPDLSGKVFFITGGSIISTSKVCYVHS